MKVIFLDIDGVLNSLEWYASDDNPGNLFPETDGELDPACIARLNDICEKTGAKIVISSDWKIDYEETCFRLKRMGFKGEIIGHTPWGWETTGYAAPRGVEIRDWITQNYPNPKDLEYVILDDDDEMLDPQQPHFVQTSYDDGLTDYLASLVIKHLY